MLKFFERKFQIRIYTKLEKYFPRSGSKFELTYVWRSNYVKIIILKTIESNNGILFALSYNFRLLFEYQNALNFSHQPTISLIHFWVRSKNYLIALDVVMFFFLGNKQIDFIVYILIYCLANKINHQSFVLPLSLF